MQEVPYADKIISYSKPGETTITFQLKEYSPARDVPQIWYTVRKKIGDMRMTLPQGVVGPFFNDDFGDVYGVIYALKSGGGFSRAEMKTIADDVRQALLRVKDVAKVEIFSAQDEKIYIRATVSDTSRTASKRLPPVREKDLLSFSSWISGSCETDSDTMHPRFRLDELDRQSPWPMF